MCLSQSSRLLKGGLPVLRAVDWYFVENEFHGQVSLGNTGLNTVNSYLVKYEEGKLTFLPQHAFHSLFIHSFIHSFIFVEQDIKFTLKNTAVIRMALWALAPQRHEEGKRQKRKVT